jgi:hypothetical protein
VNVAAIYLCGPDSVKDAITNSQDRASRGRNQSSMKTLRCAATIVTDAPWPGNPTRRRRLSLSALAICEP